jgi:hypothetical protein
MPCRKCDLKQPICENCVKGKFVCGGYQRDIIVVEVSTDGRGQYKPPQRMEVQRQDQLYEVSISDVRSRDLNRTIFEIEVFEAFWAIYLPKDVLLGPVVRFPNAPNAVERWARWTQSLTATSDTVRCALLALTVAKLGRARQDQAMVRQGLELYGKSLSQVVGELKTPSRVDRAEMIATCRLLALYEVLSLRKSYTFRGLTFTSLSL